MAESAKALRISLTTAERHWTFARAWLYAEILGDENEPAEKSDAEVKAFFSHCLSEPFAQE